MIHQSTIEHTIGSKIASMQPLSGGMISDVYRVKFIDGHHVVAKVNKETTSSLKIEAKMLDYLKGNSVLPVPDVLYKDDNLIIMSYIEHETGLSTSAEEDAAHYLSALHKVSTAQFGLSFDTLIGGIHQPNTPDESWIDFFAEQRLLYMSKTAYASRRLPLEIHRRIEQFATVLDDFLFEPDAPSLIHGDLWGGNILSKNGKITGFIDPAIYYAHSEIELAFSTLFNTFGQTFFDTYHALHPIEPDFFSVRRDIYNLYPLLVHVHLFGGDYVNAVDRILSRFGY